MQYRTMPGAGVRAGWACLGFALLAFTVPNAALAAPPKAQLQAAASSESEPPAGYREAIEEGLREFEALHFQEARSLFLKAHELLPNARTHRAVGLAEFELRNYVDSVRHLEAALASEIKPLTDTLRAETEQMLARANDFVGRATVTTTPTDARVTLDGAPLDVPSGALLLLLDIGEHSFEAKADGYIGEKRTVVVKGGEQLQLNFALVPQRASAPQAATKSEASPGDRRWYKSPWLWVATGVVVAGAAAGTSYALLRDGSDPQPSGGTSNFTFQGP